MEISKKIISYPSSNNEHNISACMWVPLGQKVKGVFQIIHGMSEHKNRYNQFAEFLAMNGYVVCANDHAGHGDSCLTPDRVGYFAEENGHKVLVKDAYRLMKIMKKTYSDIPYYVMGHSMGSFVARVFAANYGQHLSGIIFMGTGQKNPLINIAINLVNFLIRKNGALAPSPVINKIAFGSFNKTFEKRTNFDWLSRDTEEVDKYINDEKCGFLFTNSGYRDLFLIMKAATKKGWQEQIEDSLPILVISGDKDPVGNFGEGVIKVYTELTEANKTATLKLYQEARHEILNEANKYEVYEYLLNWLASQCEEKPICKQEV